jgi:L-alanine-DL-glutamate epimerase-like enolase superfamily enzyme
MKLEFKTIRLELANPWRISRTQPSEFSEIIIVKLLTKQSVVGFGEAAPIRRYSESPKSVCEFLSQIDPANLSFERVTESLAYVDSITPSSQSARCALSLALLDGAAKLNGKSLHDFLCLSFQENSYITSFSIGIDDPEIIQSKVVSAAEFPILKLKVASADDRRNLKAIREIAPTKTIRVDANEGWRTKEQALEQIEWLATDGQIEFVEQPMPASTPLTDLRWLKERSPLPIFADESYHSASDAELVAEGFHGVNVKLVKTGGIFEAMDALRSARRFGLKTMLGCMIETSVLISGAAHLASLADFWDLDGNLLITNDPFEGVTAKGGILSFAQASEKSGLRVKPKAEII